MHISCVYIINKFAPTNTPHKFCWCLLVLLLLFCSPPVSLVGGREPLLPLQNVCVCAQESEAQAEATKGSSGSSSSSSAASRKTPEQWPRARFAQTHAAASLPESVCVRVRVRAFAPVNARARARAQSSTWFVAAER